MKNFLLYFNISKSLLRSLEGVFRSVLAKAKLDIKNKLHNSVKIFFIISSLFNLCILYHINLIYDICKFWDRKLCTGFVTLNLF